MSDVLEVGWNPSLDIPSALHRVPPDRLVHHYLLVSMIDSTPSVARLPSFVPLLRDIGAFHVEVDDDVVIEAPTLSTLIDEHDFMSGFDEIWLCTRIPRSGKPAKLRITSDTPLTNEPAGLADWMVASYCCAGLGDGDGLNFATFDPEFAALWRK